MSCKCPLSTSVKEAKCDSCVELSAGNTNLDSCCVFCPDKTAVTRFASCQAASTLTVATCPTQVFTCNDDKNSTAIEFVIGISSAFFILVVVMTRALWQPRLNRCFAKYRHKAMDCPIPGIKDHRRQNMRSGDGSSSIDNLMGYQRSTSVEMVGPTANVGIALPDTVILPNDTSENTAISSDRSVVYADAVVIEVDLDGVNTEDTAVPVDKI